MSYIKTMQLLSFLKFNYAHQSSLNVLKFINFLVFHDEKIISLIDSAGFLQYASQTTSDYKIIQFVEYIAIIILMDIIK